MASQVGAPSSLKFNLYILQCKPLNLITLGQLQRDNINRMITLTEDNIYQPLFQILSITELKIQNKQAIYLITLTVITLSGAYCS